MTDAEALTTARSAHGDWYYAITKLWHTHHDHSIDARFSWEAATEHDAILCGSPARVRAQMEQLIEITGCTYVLGAFAWGSLPHAQALRSLRLFVEEVLPAFSGSAVSRG